jgi:hypothetical protein
VDAYTERLKGVLGDGGTGAAAAAYGLARAGNGSLKPLASPAPAPAPTPSSVPPATGFVKLLVEIGEVMWVAGLVSVVFSCRGLCFEIFWRMRGR